MISLKTCAAVSVLAGLMTSPGALAIERGADGYFHTGDGIRIKTIVFLKIKIYAIGHDMRDLPAIKSKQAVIDAEVDKRLSWKMLRDADGERLQGILREAFSKNSYSDASKIEPFLAAFRGGLKEGDRVVITYSAASKMTTVEVAGVEPVHLSGTEAMRATWSIWFGKSDDPELADALISRI
jgi:hypothetical protein